MAPADSRISVRPSPPENINYVKEAFHLQYNWIAMAGAAAFALVSGSSADSLAGGSS